MRSDLFLLILLLTLLELLFLLSRFGHLSPWKDPTPEKSLRKPAVLRPKTEKDCPVCQTKQADPKSSQQETPPPWPSRKSRAGRKKHISTQGYFCSNQKCAYYAIADERIHALVGNGIHGKYENIQDFKCKACGKKFTARKHTILYRLKTHSRLVRTILHLLVLGVDASALEEAFGIRESTIRTWLCRSGCQAKKLHERFFAHLHLDHVQLDELWTNVKHGSQDIWLWTACDAQTKLLPVMQLGPRTQKMAYSVVHELKHRLAPACVPVFATDGLKFYFYALTAHFGKWVSSPDHKKPVWALFQNFLYAQVIKHQRRRKTFAVERKILVGEETLYQQRLKLAGLTGLINTAFVERLNLSIRQCVSTLTRRTWGPAKFSPELLEHLEWWRAYYHFVRFHETLNEPLPHPISRKGKQIPRKYCRRTPAMMAGLTDRPWTIMQLLALPLI